MNINWTNVVVTLAVGLVFWLFVPSPFHKCPKPEPKIITDTLWVKPADIDTLKGTSVSTDGFDEVSYEMIQEDTISSFVHLLTFEHTSTIPIRRDSTWIVANGDTLGYVVQGAAEAVISSTVYYAIGDSLAQTIHEVSLPPRTVEPVLFPREIKFRVEPVALPDKPTPILESPVTWGLIGVIVGGIIVLIIKEKEEQNAD